MGLYLPVKHIQEHVEKEKKDIQNGTKQNKYPKLTVHRGELLHIRLS